MLLNTATQARIPQHWHLWSCGVGCVLHLGPKRLCRSRRMCGEKGFESDGLGRKGKRECRAAGALGFERAAELLG